MTLDGGGWNLETKSFFLFSSVFGGVDGGFRLVPSLLSLLLLSSHWPIPQNSTTVSKLRSLALVASWQRKESSFGVCKQ